MTLVAHELGDPARPALVFLHALGIGPSGRYVSEIAPLLRRRVLGVDGAGFGDSAALEPAEYELPSYAWRVVAVLGALRVDRAALLGHSWGGVVACQVATIAPERVSALVLLDSGHLDYGDQPGFEPELPLESWIESARARQWTWASREAFLEELRDDAPGLAPEYEQAVLAGMTVEPDGSLRGAPPEVRGAVYRAISRARTSATWPAIAGAGIPTLLLLATEPPDRAAENEAGAARLLAAIPGATVVAVPGAGHDLIADAGPEIAAVIADWLDANGPG